jgi:hypothetical protein
VSDQILVGTRKGTFVVQKTRGAWEPALVGHAGVCCNYAARDPHTGTLWAALGFGHFGAKLSRSDDGGKTWRDASQVKYPAYARYLGTPLPDETGTTGPTILRDATLLLLWTLAFGPGGHVYVGTIPGGLFVSRDNGESFELNRPLWDHESRGGDLSKGKGKLDTQWFGTPASIGEFAPGIDTVLVNPKDPQHLFIAISTAGVLDSPDGGKTWRNRNKGLINDYLPDPKPEWGYDSHAIDFCKGNPDHVWQQSHCGVFYSSDGAATWKRVSQPGDNVHFGFPIAVHESRGGTAWVVPGKSDMQRTAIDGGLFVARTQDGGQSWEPLRHGLPQVHAYDVVLRHALGYDDGCLAFGSTTGNLYISEDAGETWRTAANNLPPIYSVRFA